MNHGLTDTIKTDEALNAAQTSASPTLGVIALRFVTLLAAIVAVFTWAWSR
ncbi:MAG: hypothetical protein JWR73_644 [Tardiphaga sp.]|jgi:hypothetical protein|nr:hypothetical protein [Tardiphaga sp.]MDB5520555.1 hypothetical protein [Tardiphaga sp.]MDB5624842.1 hypothetical protein [Tardiphaga sp.]